MRSIIPEEYKSVFVDSLRKEIERMENELINLGIDIEDE